MRGGLLRRISSVLALLFLCLSANAAAHQLAPVLLDIVEAPDGSARISWTRSVTMVRGANVVPKFPDHCFGNDTPTIEEHEDRVIQEWTITCGEAGLVGQTIGIAGLETAFTDAVVRFEAPDGNVVRSVLRAGEPELVIPEKESALDVIRGYATLGVEHILSGWDHLAFVFGLLLLVRGFGLLVKTITAFTVGHSVTLTLTVLGVTPLPSGPVEFAIALSIFLLAAELARDERPERSAMQRYPWVIAAGFGLLHGAGFAGALVEIGLPQAEIPLALLAFNVGIELGQLAFIAATMLLWLLLRGPLGAAPPVIRWIPVYGLGCFSVFWCLQRGVGLFFG